MVWIIVVSEATPEGMPSDPPRKVFYSSAATTMSTQYPPPPFRRNIQFFCLAGEITLEWS